MFSPAKSCLSTSRVPAMTPVWMPSMVVPPWVSSMSLCMASMNQSHEMSLE